MVQERLLNKEDRFIDSLNLNNSKIEDDLIKMKEIKGFPNGEIGDILNLSEPPYYTAYPNPYLNEFINFYGNPFDEESDNYDKEPYVGDISIGKNDKLYSLHSYHTKVPYKSIEKYIEHYTEEGDLVFDGFCGTGQTALAAQILGRNAIVMDLGVAPTFIAMNYNNETLLSEIKINFKEIIKEIKEELGWIYNIDGEEINFTIWSEVRTCQFCGKPFNVWQIAVKDIGKDFSKTFNCENCNSEISMTKSKVLFDNHNQRTYVPVKLNIFKGKKRVYEDINEKSEILFKKIDSFNNPYWYPTYKMMFESDIWGDRCIKQDCPGVSQINHLYFKRTILILSAYFEKCRRIKNKRVRNSLIFIGTSSIVRLTKLNRYISKYKSNKGPYSGTLYMPPFIAEQNAIKGLERKFNKLCKIDFPERKGSFICSTQSATDLKNIPENSVDYIFIDPPFGWNLMYSELNFNWESWLKVFTNNSEEAIVSKFQHKDNNDYANLMKESFINFFNILKPERWITVEFHNSSAEIWNLIQKSLVEAGFIIAQVNVLDKKLGTINQDFLDNAVKNDLVINAYKPSSSFSNKFLKTAGLNMEKEFIGLHLKKLPIEINLERTQQRLYSKLLSYYIQNGFEVRLDAPDFYKLLKRYFTEINGNWFNFNQVEEYYQKNKLSNDKFKEQTILGFNDEKTAIIWLNQFLKKPKTYDEIYIGFTKNSLTSEDKIPELKALLDENFIFEDGKYMIPSNLKKVEKEEIRNKKLLKEFNIIFEEVINSNKKINSIRKEALLFGLIKLYQSKKVKEINILREKLDKKIIESDEDISNIFNWAKYKSE